MCGRGSGGQRRIDGSSIALDDRRRVSRGRREKSSTCTTGAGRLGGRRIWSPILLVEHE